MMMRRTRVLLMLMVMTAVVPILLYTDRLRTFNASPKAISEFVEDVSFSKSLVGNVRELRSTLQKDLLLSSNGQNGVVRDDSAGSNTLTAEVGVVLEKTLSNWVERKSSRVINMADDGSQSQMGLQIGSTDHEDKKGGFDDRNTSKQGLAQKNLPLSNQTASVTEERRDTHEQQSTSHSSAHNVDSEIPVGIKNKSDQKFKADARVRLLKDLLIRGKVYLSLPATRTNPHFIRELRLRIKEATRALGDASKDSELPRNAKEKMKALEQILAKGMQISDECATVVKKLRAVLHSTEEQLRAHTKQTMFLTQLTAKTLPKGLHCLPLRLSVDYQSLNESEKQFPDQHNLEAPDLYHYAVFSDNILATAVVVNSTVSHAKDPSKHVFHIVTDRLNYAAMRMWFISNPPRSATIQVQKVEDFTWLNSSYSPTLKQLESPSMIEYYFKPDQANPDPNLKFRNPKYLSILNHLRFYVPEIFPKLNKVLFLDDDIVVQKDLSALWSIDLKGNVNGAVETCGESFHRFDSYLNFSNPLIAKNFDPQACGWGYGMNIFDLKVWKKQNMTEVYHSWQKLNVDRNLWKLGTLPPGLILFYKHTFPLNRTWHLLGLGYNPNVNQRDIEQAAVIHYNGNMKPWLEVGIPKFRKYWSKFIDYDNMYFQECKINP